MDDPMPPSQLATGGIKLPPIPLTVTLRFLLSRHNVFHEPDDHVSYPHRCCPAARERIRDVMVITQILAICPHSPIKDPPRGSLRHKGNIDNRPVHPKEKGQPKRSGKRAQTFPLLICGMGVKITRDDDVNTNSAVSSCTQLNISEVPLESNCGQRRRRVTTVKA